MFGKRIAALLAAALLVVSLAACNSSTSSSTDSGSTPAQSSESTADSSTAESASTEDSSEAATDLEPITYNFLMDWNGGAYGFPDGWDNGPVAQAIIEKLGVSLNVETITTSETEKLALVFASGDVPDITNAPFWDTIPGGEGEQIKNAALDGMLLDLNPYVDQFPNVKRAMEENISTAFSELHYENADFAGARYIIPNKPMTKEDTTNWAYGVYARKDILESLGVEPTSITTADELYDLLNKIKDGGFTDISGKPVIPAGNWHNGWSYDQYTLTFWPGGNNTRWEVVDGKIVHEYMREEETEKILYMRKLVSEGLYDAEALTQTDTLGKEKMATGRVATFGCHWPHMNGFFESTLYLTNPEMEYVVLGPFLRTDGTPATTESRLGAYGFGCLFLSADIEQPERALGLIDYLSSDEGWTLAKFGIEGTHYTREGDIVTRTEEWTTTKAQDQQTYYLEGFGFENLAMDDREKSYGWSVEYNKPGWVYAREVRDLVFFDGYTAKDIAEQWEGKAEFDATMATVNYEDLKKVAITAASDDEAIKILEDYRQKMRDAGYDEMMAFIQEKMDADPNITT
ncbi:MAG: hypothetical protein ACK5LX_04645 [Oscillospiraceae bacterium]